MTTGSIRLDHDRQRFPRQVRWAAILAILGCLLGGRTDAGTLTVTSNPIVTANKVHLSAEGDLDWAHWGTFTASDFNHKIGVDSQISNFTMLGGSPITFGNAAGNFTWLDGSIDQVLEGRTSGVYVNGPPNNGFQLSIPASATTKVLHLYIGRFNALGQLDLTLSDGTSLSLTNNGNNRFSITFADSTPSATLKVEYYNLTAGGNVTLMAASLASATSLPLSVGEPQVSTSTTTVPSGSTLDLLAKPLGVAEDGRTTFAYQWQVDGVDIPDGTRNPITITAGAPGTHLYQVVITNSILGTAVTSAPVTLTVTTATGKLSASSEDLPASGVSGSAALDVDLTAEGTIDWAHWGTTTPTDYDTRANLIGNFTQIGTDAASLFNSTVTYTWSDATTANAAVAAGNVGLGLPVNNGFALSIPASSSETRLVHLYVGVGSGAGLRVEASLSDNSAPIFTENPRLVGGTRRYSFAFQAASEGQTLNVKLTEPERTTGNGSISLQAATLQPVPPLSVADLVVDPGTSVLVNQPMIVSVPPLEPRGTPPFSYQWRRDTGSGLTNVPGATGRSFTFSAGSSPGEERCDVLISDARGTIASTPVLLTRSAATGVLTLLSKDLITGINNLTTEGSIDWAHWGAGGAGGFDQKESGGGTIGNYIPVGPGSINGYGGASSFTWTDGTPNLALTNSQGIYHNGIGNGFELNVRAAMTNRVLHVYLGSFNCVAHVEAFLSDGSAIKLIDETMPFGQARRFNILFAAGSPDQTLIFRFWDLNGSGGNVTLMAASLEGVPLLSVDTPVVGPATTVAAGSTIYLDSQGANGLAPLHYQWWVDTGGGYASIPNSDNPHLTTNAGGIGTSNFRVVVTDLTGSVTSAPVTLTVTAPTSTLIGSSTPVNVDTQETIDLTAEGTIDWRHWGASGYDQKDPIANQISEYSIVGVGPVFNYGGNGVHCVWTDGTPSAMGDSLQGVYINGAPNGFELTAEAASYERIFNLYCAVFQSTMHVEAMMSDNSAPVFVDESFTGGSASAQRYSFRYSSPTPGQHLIVRWWNAAGANITINAATLGYGDIKLQAQSAGGSRLQVTWPVGTLEEASSLAGPWSRNAAVSPYTFTPSDSQNYYRVVVE